MKDNQKNERMYCIPPSFTEQASPAYIDYKLFVTVHRGMLSVNQVCVVLGQESLAELKFRVAFRPRRSPISHLLCDVWHI